MRFQRMIATIDTHTEGEPTRTIIGGLPHIPGDSVAAKMAYVRDNLDDLRRMLMYEPRGNEVMSGVILTPPCRGDADIGVIYIEVGGYLPMCGHDTIGCCTALVETGIVPVEEPITTIRLDTPAGLVVARVAVVDGSAKQVTFTNAPAFLYRKDVNVDVPGYGRVTLDIAYGGNFYALVEARQLGLEITAERAGEIVQAGKAVRAAVNGAIRVQHPEMEFIEGLTHVEFYGPPTHPDADVKNAVVIPPGSIDRSPCGTGTSAKLAVLHARGKLREDEEFVHESIIGTIFRARIVGTTQVGPFAAVIPEISGRAYVTGIHHFVVDPEDPLKRGFLLGVGSS
jgi:proline racemase